MNIYEAPRAEVVELHNEGVFCLSGDMGGDSHEKWDKEEDFEW